MKKKDDEKNFFCCAIIYYYYCISIYGIYDIYGITITIFTTLRFYGIYGKRYGSHRNRIISV